MIKLRKGVFCFNIIDEIYLIDLNTENVYTISLSDYNYNKDFLVKILDEMGLLC